jgi:predicted DNA binding CopG/RHH family protein
MNEKKNVVNHKRELKDCKVNLRISKSDFDVLNNISLKEDLPMSQLIRKAVRTYVDEHNNRA